MQIDHNAVLEMWDAGATSTVIAEVLGLADSASARVVIRRARSKGDPRAIRRVPERIDLEPDLRAAIAMNAKKRRTTPSVVLREAVCSYLGVAS